MPGLRDRRFTIYDAMEAAGVFEANPANSYSRDPTTGDSMYSGPVEYPKIFYSPEGDQELVPGCNPEDIETKGGKILRVNEHWQLVTKVAKNKDEERQLREEGWHDHPSDAMRANPKLAKAAPAKTSTDRIAELEGQIARLQADRDATAAGALAARASAPLSIRPAPSPSEAD